MMLADISQGEGWILGCTIVMALAAIAAVIIAIVALKNKTETIISPQPLIVAMQKEFATKSEFEAHVHHNHGVHENLFSKIGGVERGAAAALERQLETVRKDVVLVGNQVSGLKAQTELQNQQLARMDAKLDRIAEKS